MLGIIITLYTTSIISGLLRFYTHGVIIKRFFAEDILTLIALVRTRLSVRAPRLLQGGAVQEQNRLTVNNENSSYLLHIQYLEFLQSHTVLENTPKMNYLNVAQLPSCTDG